MNRRIMFLLLSVIILLAGCISSNIPSAETNHNSDKEDTSKVNSTASPIATVVPEPIITPLQAPKLASGEPASPIEATQEPTKIIGKSINQIIGNKNLDGELYAGDKNGNSTNFGLAAVGDGYLFITEDFDLATQYDGKIVKINLNTGEKSIFVDKAGAALSYHDGWLYYADISKAAINAGPIYRIMLDGSGLELIYKDYCACFIHKQNSLIYYNFTHEKLYKADLSNLSDEHECIVSYEIRWINDAGEQIIFYNTKQKIIQSLDVNTNKITDLYQPGDIMYMTKSGSKLYYIKNNGEDELLTSYDLDTEEEKTVIDTSIARFNLYKDRIIFTYLIKGQSERIESMVYLFDLITKEVSEIGIGNIGTIYGDRMIYWVHGEDQFPYVKIMDLIP